MSLTTKRPKEDTQRKVSTTIGFVGIIFTNPASPFLRNLGSFSSSFPDRHTQTSHHSSYYISLPAISVGGLLVSPPQSVFEFDETGEGGVIADSGTSVTRLQKGAYKAVRDAFVAGTSNLPRASGIAIFDACYDLSDCRSVSVPIHGFHFLNGTALILSPGNYLIPVDSKGTFCLAFAPTAGDLSIIGNIQQQHFRVSIDSENSLVGFAPNQC